MNVDLRRAALVLSLVILLGGYAALVRPLETSIAECYAELDDARASIDRNVALAKRIGPMMRERELRSAGVARLHLLDSRAALVDRFLAALAVVTARDHIALQAVLTLAVQPVTPASTGNLPALVDELPYDVTVRGRYADVIRAARDLDAGDFAARIVVAGLRSTRRLANGQPQIDAAFHVTLLREADATTGPIPHPG